MIIEKSEIAKELKKLKSLTPSNKTDEVNGVLFKDNMLVANNFEMTATAKLPVDTDEAFVIPMKAIELMINLFFVEETPERITEEVINSIIDFYRCGKQETRKQKAVRRTVKNKKKVYDFECDDAYVYAAFVSAYNIDLNEIDYLHWWKFKALFNGLPSDCEFVKIMGYRATDTTAIKDNKERSRILKLQALYALPEHLTVEEKAARIGAVLGGGIK